VRRKPGSLLPIEVAICAAAGDLRRRGIEEFHGYELARKLSDLSDSRLLTAYGTLYRALARLEKMGLLMSRGEAPELAARENRPSRHLYTLTTAGDRVATDAVSAVAARESRHPVRTARHARRRWVPA
jgi:DNA-binding PadR family transcriptional regulator